MELQEQDNNQAEALGHHAPDSKASLGSSCGFRVCGKSWMNGCPSPTRKGRELCRFRERSVVRYSNSRIRPLLTLYLGQKQIGWAVLIAETAAREGITIRAALPSGWREAERTLEAHTAKPRFTFTTNLGGVHGLILERAKI